MVVIVAAVQDAASVFSTASLEQPNTRATSDCGSSFPRSAIVAVVVRDKDTIDSAANYYEMVARSGHPLSPCVVVDGRMLADVSGEKVEAWLADKGYIQQNSLPTPVPIDRACPDELHAANVAFEE